ncbi:hypothetical protein GCM10028803_03760 [Larkinella knui]|uniref:Uncharacterized protein n=1 Tax=Larkinella knui TaxID=2025310 RepID=A0A3P1CLI9_9BACT|nr:DUF6526 family protein [Larkinella knui]RRB13936.1 hypothetical protein EHT87_16930 [Larkinella knui]
MKTQNYENHVRYYPPHHFVFYPVVLVLLGLSLYFAFTSEEQSLIWLFIALLIGLITWVAFMLRQHYALGNQNRIVRLEMRFRYYVLTNQRLETIENQLSFGQLLALRFASDEELPGLTQRALADQLSPDAIKKAIVNWTPDHMRV